MLYKQGDFVKECFVRGRKSTGERVKPEFFQPVEEKVYIKVVFYSQGVVFFRFTRFTRKIQKMRFKMRCFTEFDVFGGYCEKSEVGMTWEDRFGIDDLVKGNCKAERLGKVRNETVENSPPACFGDDVDLMTTAERKILIARIHDAALRAIAADVSGMISDSASVVNKILEQSAKLLEKEDDGKAPIDGMTDAELEKIPNGDLKRYIIATSAPGAQYTEEARVALINEIAREVCQHCGKKPFKPLLTVNL